MTTWAYVLLAGLLLSVVTNVWLVLRVLMPLRRLVAQAINVSQGQLAAFQQPCGGIREIGMLRHTMASMAGHVRRAHEDGLAYRHALTDGQEAERARIARELHDDTVQALIAISQGIDLASNWIVKDPERAITMLKMARTQAVETVVGLRRLIANLRPPALAELGLIPALKMLAESENNSEVSVLSKGKERRLDEAYELTLFRSAQEAVRNAQRHGRARHIIVDVDYQLKRVGLTVQDDGQGFQTPDGFDYLAKAGHYGLLGMQERVQHLNGSVQISSEEGVGTKLMVTLPIQALHQPTETVRDPVCGVLIQAEQAYGSTEYQGQHYYFCCPVCQGAFQRSPEAYLDNRN